MRLEKALIPVTIILLALVLVVAYSQNEREEYIQAKIDRILETSN